MKKMIYFFLLMSMSWPSLSHASTQDILYRWSESLHSLSPNDYSRVRSHFVALNRLCIDLDERKSLSKPIAVQNKLMSKDLVATLTVDNHRNALKIVDQYRGYLERASKVNWSHASIPSAVLQSLAWLMKKVAMPKVDYLKTLIEKQHYQTCSSYVSDHLRRVK